MTATPRRPGLDRRCWSALRSHPGVAGTCATAGPRLQVEPSRRRAWRTASRTSAATGRARRDTKPGGNIGKDLPGWKLPLTPAGEAALKHNLTATIDPESLCIIGGIPRHNASGLPFEVLQGTNKIAFLYWYSYFRLIPIDPNRKHSDDPDPSFFGEELGRWEGDTLVIDSIGFKDEKVWIDENANPHSDALHVVERWTRPDADHIHVETLIEDPKFYTQTVHVLANVGARKARRGNPGIRVQREQRRCGPSRLRTGSDPSRWHARLHRSCAAAAAASSRASEVGW